MFRAAPISIKFNDIASNTDIVPSDVQLLRVGTFYHEVYGRVELTKATLLTFKENFERNVRKVDLAIDYKHDSDDVAAGWIETVYLAGEDSELWARVKWTPNGKRVLADKEFRYLSADFTFEYQDNETLTKYGPTLFGAGLTNRPVIKDMTPAVELSEVNLKIKAANERSQQYGIELAGDALDCADPEKWADPVNCKYDMSNLDEARKQFKDDVGFYKNDKSKTAVHERIVRNMLSNGLSPSYDENDSLDNLLPSDLKEKLSKGDGMKPEEMMKVIEELKAKIAELEGERDLMLKEKKLAEQKTQFDKLLLDGKACEAQRESFIAGDVVKFSELAKPVKLETAGTETTPATEPAKVEVVDTEEEILKLAEAKIKAGETKDLGKAISLVLSENQELAKKHKGE